MHCWIVWMIHHSVIWCNLVPDDFSSFQSISLTICGYEIVNGLVALWFDGIHVKDTNTIAEGSSYCSFRRWPTAFFLMIVIVGALCCGVMFSVMSACNAHRYIFAFVG